MADDFGRRGRLVVTHAGELSSGPHLTDAECVELADRGAVIEITALTCRHVEGVGSKSAAQIAAQIQAIGTSRVAS